MLQIKSQLSLVLIVALLAPVIGLAKEKNIIIHDSLKRHVFKQTPKRIVVLNWAIAQDLLALEAKPIAIAEPQNYKEWVVSPSLPKDIVDVGLRDEPSIEAIAQEKPDLIILSNGQSNLIPKLTPIAPVLYFDAYNKSHNNYTQAKNIFLELSKLVNKQSLALEKIKTSEREIAGFKRQLHRHFGKRMPEVAMVRFNSPEILFVYGNNSMPQYALEALGIKPALLRPATQWGVTQTRVVTLGQLKHEVVIYIKPFYQSKQLMASPLWKAMPFVRNNHFLGIKSTWTYGGFLSVQALAKEISTALLKINP